MSVFVRSVAQTDADVIASLLSQLGYASSSHDVADRLAYWAEDPYSEVLVADNDSQVAGCLSLHAVPYLEHTGRWARIESLVIDHAVPGTGIGRELLQAAEDLAYSWGCLAVEVTSARRRHDAHAFYQRMGYIDICDRAGRFWKRLR